MKKNVAIVAGGYSSEYEVSIKSARNLYDYIDKEKYNAYIVLIERAEWIVQLPGGETASVDRNDFSFKENGVDTPIHFAYITIHGTPGENGLLQGYFEMLRIPYSACGVLTSALTFNKYACNMLLRSQGVIVADSVCLRRGQAVDHDQTTDRLGGLPVFVKPTDSGSSFGVSRVDEASQLSHAIDKAFAESEEVMLERLVSGVEVSCGCYKTKGNICVLPVTEVVPANQFFDYDAKYNGQVQEITPARLSPEVTARVQQITNQIYRIINARGIIRVDYIIPADGQPVLLEINTTPGMTNTSFIPQQVRAAGLSLTNILTEIIENE